MSLNHFHNHPVKIDKNNLFLIENQLITLSAGIKSCFKVIFIELDFFS